MAKGILMLTVLDEILYPLPVGFIKAAHFHITLQFGIEHPLKEHSSLGKCCFIKVTGVANNDRIMALTVELPSDVECCNEIPHITIGHLPEIKPFESNQMLREAFEFTPCNSCAL